MRDRRVRKVYSMCLDGASGLEQTLELALLRLQVAVATDMLLRDEDIGHTSLAGYLFKGILKSCAIICASH